MFTVLGMQQKGGEGQNAGSASVRCQALDPTFVTRIPRLSTILRSATDTRLHYHTRPNLTRTTTSHDVLLAGPI